jgi:ferredoxin-NADP reductase
VAPENKHKFLFLAGGVGITPIRALMENLRGKNKDMVLIYSAKTKDDLAFYEELKNFGQKNYFTLSKEQRPGFELGRIDAEKIKKLAPDFMQREIFVCGPKDMITSVTAELLTLDVPKEQIHSEKFEY